MKTLSKNGHICLKWYEIISEFQAWNFFPEIKAMFVCIICLPVYLGLVCLFQMDFIWLGVLIWFILLFSQLCRERFYLDSGWLLCFFMPITIFFFMVIFRKKNIYLEILIYCCPLKLTWALFHAHAERRELLLLGSYYIPVNTP